MPLWYSSQYYNRVEESIKSVFKPNYNIVIVDSYSNDGTWEKLQELKGVQLDLIQAKVNYGEKEGIMH